MSAVFRDALLARRERYNALFAEARHYQPQLDGAAFGLVLIDSVAPLVEAVAGTGGDAEAVTDDLYTVALELYGHGMLGPERNDPWVTAGWTAMTALARPLGRAPRRVAAAVSNALRNLGQTPGARPAAWLDSLRVCAEMEDEPDTLLKAGQALAFFRGNKAVTLDDLRNIVPFVLHDKLVPDTEAPFFDAAGNQVYRVDRVGWIRRLFDLSCAEYDRLSLDKDDPVTALESEFDGGLQGVSEADARARLVKIERLLAEWGKGRKLYGPMFDDILKLKYLHQRYTNYLAWLLIR